MKILGFNNFKKDECDIIENHYPMQNVLNILGWFPFLGTIIGCIRIGSNFFIYVADDESNEYKHKKYYMLSSVRGVVEIFCLGWVFVIPDIISSLTLKRKLKKAAKKAKKEESFGVIEL